MVSVVRSRAVRLLGVTGLVGLVAVLAGGCSASEFVTFGWPEGVTEQAGQMRTFWIWSVIASLVVGVTVWALILWPVVFHRRHTDELPRQFQYNLPLEIVYTALPFMIITGLFYFTVTTQNSVLDKVEDPDVRVRVVGFQWNWEFQYLQDDKAGPDGQFDPLQTEMGTPVSTVGSSATVPILVVPTDRVVEYHLESKDVIHSFFVPDFLFKRDVFPHPEKNDSDNVFQTTVEEDGAFVGRCAELCGTYHAYMTFELRALPVDLFERYLDLKTQTNPVTQQPYTTADALSELNCGELCAPQAVTTRPFDTTRGKRESAQSVATP